LLAHLVLVHDKLTSENEIKSSLVTQTTRTWQINYRPVGKKAWARLLIM